MIKTFGTSGTSDIFYGIDSKAARRTCPPDLWSVARRKLDAISIATSLDQRKVPRDLRMGPGRTKRL
jgi:proteic killer suppression protein